MSSGTEPVEIAISVVSETMTTVVTEVEEEKLSVLPTDVLMESKTAAAKSEGLVDARALALTATTLVRVKPMGGWDGGSDKGGGDGGDGGGGDGDGGDGGGGNGEGTAGGFHASTSQVPHDTRHAAMMPL